MNWPLMSQTCKLMQSKSCATCVLLSLLLTIYQLQLLGFSLGWVSFKVLEIISHSKFTHKRIGYLAASCSFSETTDVLLLITNLIRKVSGRQTKTNYNRIACPTGYTRQVWPLVAFPKFVPMIWPEIWSQTLFLS